MSFSPGRLIGGIIGALLATYFLFKGTKRLASKWTSVENAILWGFIVSNIIWVIYIALVSFTFPNLPFTVRLEETMWSYFPPLVLWLVIDFRKLYKNIDSRRVKNVKILRLMSVIGIVWYILCLFLVSAMISIGDAVAAGGAGIFAILYAIAHAIVGIAKAKPSKDMVSSKEQLLELNDLREKGVLTDDEFNEKKRDILQNM